MAEQEPNLADRNEVIEASRRRYGMPRTEVEHMIAKQMGWPTPEELIREQRDRLSHRLQGLEVTERQAKYLLSSYSLDRIQQQLDWLPFRQSTHNPAAFIIAAVRRNYDPPEGIYVDQGHMKKDEGKNEDQTLPIQRQDTEQDPNKE